MDVTRLVLLAGILGTLSACSGRSTNEGGRTASKHGESITCPAGTKVYDRGAKLTCLRGKAEFHGPYIEWSLASDRHKALEGTYLNGRKQGVWTQYHPNGTKYGQGPVRDGSRHGPWKQWAENGDLVLTSEFDNGRRTGTWTYFTAGQVTRVEDHGDQALENASAFGADGKLEQREQWTRLGSGTRVHRSETYDGDGSVSVTTTHQDREGSRTYHEIAGKVVKVERHRNGERVHVTVCRDGHPTRTFWIAGNDTPGHPRHEVEAGLDTASPCAIAAAE